MDNKQIITVEESIVNYIERLDYEYTTRKNLIAFMISSNMDITTEAFNKYQTDMIEYQIKFDKAKQQLEDNYINPIRQNKDVNWSLDYKTQELTISYL